MLESILKSIFSAGTFQQMLRSATPVALAALGGSLTEHAGIKGTDFLQEWKFLQ